VHESSIPSLPPPSCAAHTVAILLQYYCALYNAPPTALLYATHHTILLMAVSCKCQRAVRVRVNSSSFISILYVSERVNPSSFISILYVSERGEHRLFQWGRRVCGGVSSALGGSAVWPQCWLCAVCAVGHVGCCVEGGGVPCGGKHIIRVKPESFDF